MYKNPLNFSSCYYNKKISSVYPHETSGLKLQSCNVRSFRSPIKIIAYGGAILVPLTVIMLKKIFFKTPSGKFIRESVDIVLSSLDSEDFLNAIKPSSCSMFGYKPTTSIVYRKSSGKGGD